jgi:5-methylthioribose kinase
VLDQLELVRYLVDHKMLAPQAIVDGEVAIKDVSSRNANFVVECSAQPSLFVKQAVDAATWTGLEREAAAYLLLQERSRTAAKSMPQLLHYDRSEQLLVLELFERSRSLRDYHVQSGRFSKAISRRVGEILGAMTRDIKVFDLDSWHASAPWSLSIHRPDLSLFADVSGATLELIKLLQSSQDLMEDLDALRGAWAPTAFIHGDLKWDNILVRITRGKPPGVWVVDWESAVAGDPLWDIGSLFASYLSFWIFSIPVVGITPPERFPDMARYPLEKMQGAVRAGWAGFRSAAGLNGSDENAALRSAIAYTAGRLLHLAMEASQMTNWLSGNIVLHAQLSANMLQRPEDTATHLLGIPLRL